MNRELTKREKILLLIFAILIIVLGYYKIILEPIDDQISNYEGMQLQEETEVDTKTTQAVKMSVMEKEIEKAKASGIERRACISGKSEPAGESGIQSSVISGGNCGLSGFSAPYIYKRESV